MDNKYSQRQKTAKAKHRRTPLARTKNLEAYSEQAKSEDLSYMQTDEDEVGHRADHKADNQNNKVGHSSTVRSSDEFSDQRFMLPQLDQSKRMSANRPETRRGIIARRMQQSQSVPNMHHHSRQNKDKTPTRTKKIRDKHHPPLPFETHKNK